jgi:hypothetical protein
LVPEMLVEPRDLSCFPWGLRLIHQALELDLLLDWSASEETVLLPAPWRSTLCRLCRLSLESWLLGSMNCEDSSVHVQVLVRGPLPLYLQWVLWCWGKPNDSIGEAPAMLISELSSAPLFRRGQICPLLRGRLQFDSTDHLKRRTKTHKDTDNFLSR